MKNIIQLKSSDQARVFEQALFEYLDRIYEQGDNSCVFVTSRQEGKSLIKVVECNSIHTIFKLCAYIQHALERLEVQEHRE